MRAAEQVLYTQSKGLLGDHDPKSNEFSVQIRAMSPVSGASSLSIPILLSICSAALKKSLKGGFRNRREYKCRGDPGAHLCST